MQFSLQSSSHGKETDLRLYTVQEDSKTNLDRLGSHHLGVCGEQSWWEDVVTQMRQSTDTRNVLLCMCLCTSRPNGIVKNMHVVFMASHEEAIQWKHSAINTSSIIPEYICDGLMSTKGSFKHSAFLTLHSQMALNTSKRPNCTRGKRQHWPWALRSLHLAGVLWEKRKSEFTTWITNVLNCKNDY